MLDEGSFRDPDGRVFHAGGKIFRALTVRGVERYDALAKAGVWRMLEESGLAIGSRRCELDEVTLPAGGFNAAIELQRIPFVSYPYEWSFEMLREAALTHLKIMAKLLPGGWILKDSSAFNYQFTGEDCLLMDLMSVEPRAAHESWVGYTQFCNHFLNPLLAASSLNLEPHTLLRGRLEGLSAEETDALVPLWRQWRAGAWMHVRVQALLQRRAAGVGSERDLFQDLPDQKNMILSLVAKMRRLMERLPNPAAASVWADYEREHNYSDEGRRVKEQALRECVEKIKPGLAFDLGANVGEFSRIAAEHSAQVVAFDLEGAVTDRLFRRLRLEKIRKVIPLVMDLSNPSPDQGFAGRERRSWIRRGNPDLVIAFAVLHHVAIYTGVPLGLMLEWLHGLGAADLLVEWVPPEDPQVRRLLKNRRDVYADYTTEHFLRIAPLHFEVLSRRAVPSSPRDIIHLRRK